MAEAKAQTYNIDVDGLIRRIKRYIVEIVKAQSSGTSGNLSWDIARMRSYVAGVRNYMAWAVGQPEMDFPETFPQVIDLPEAVELPPMENDSLYDVSVLLQIAVDELSNSQSSRKSAGLEPGDQRRLTAILDRIDNFINNYINVTDPLDVPESSPTAPMTGGGLTGI